MEHDRLDLAIVWYTIVRFGRLDLAQFYHLILLNDRLVCLNLITRSFRFEPKSKRYFFQILVYDCLDLVKRFFLILLVHDHLDLSTQ